MSRLNTLLIPSPAIRSGRLVSFFPTGLYSLKEMSRREGFEVDVLNLAGDIRNQVFASVQELNRSILALIDLESYNIIGLSTMGGTFPITVSLAKEIKRLKPLVTIILGGPHSSFLPAETLRDFPFVDAVVVGEGEHTFSEMLRCFQSSSADWRDIPGVAIRNHPFRERELIKNLDELPVLEYGDCRKLHLNGDSKGQIEVEGVRGCYAKCRFCATTQFWGCRVRRKSASRLVKEMIHLAGLTGLSECQIIGDNFTYPLKTFDEICRHFIKEGSGLHWKCDTRIGDLEKSDLKLMKDAGCTSIFVGIESSSPETLERINKKIDLAKTIVMVREALDLGIQVVASQIIGFPWETEPDVMATLKLHTQLLDWGVANSLVNPLFPLAGAEGFPGVPVVTDISRIEETLPLLFQDQSTKELIRQYPRQFIQFGYYETPHLRRSFIKAVIETAQQIGRMKRGET
jgi:radical SAM superfamily enzyme YgiQ (UPF0313 family)